jgi:hypothetical protein
MYICTLMYESTYIYNIVSTYLVYSICILIYESTHIYNIVSMYLVYTIRILIYESTQHIYNGDEVIALFYPKYTKLYFLKPLY